MCKRRTPVVRIRIFRPWLLWCAIALHVIYGGAAFFDRHALQLVPLQTTSGLGQVGSAVVFWGASVCALVGMWAACWKKYWRMAMFVPQQCLVLLAAMRAMQTIVDGYYMPGIPCARSFIAANEAATIFFAVFHTMAYLDRVGAYRYKTRPSMVEHHVQDEA